MKKEMIEKIREKVILANNPECKNYDEALEKEFLQEGCIIKSKDEYIIIPESKQEKYCIYVNNYSYEKDPEALSYWIRTLGCGCCSTRLYESNDLDPDSSYENYKILGLPLTLERVLVALNYYSEDSKINDLMTQDWGNMPGSAFGVIYQFGSEVFTIFWGRVEICGIVEGNSEYNEEKTIDWQPNITLENQTDETIKAIYNILCV